MKKSFGIPVLFAMLLPARIEYRRLAFKVDTSLSYVQYMLWKYGQDREEVSLDGLWCYALNAEDWYNCNRTEQ